MPRLQFSLRALLVAMLVVAAFFSGAVWQRRLDIHNEVERLINEERSALSATEAAQDARQKAIDLDEAKLMKGWHQFRIGTDSLGEAREQLIEMGRKQAEKERDDAIARQAIERLRP
jgi:hypothetical protein